MLTRGPEAWSVGLSGLAPGPSVVDPGTNVRPWKQRGPTPWIRSWWCTIRFSVYSPRGLSVVGVFGQTTTNQYLRALVGLAASSAAWIVLNGLSGPTSASLGLVGFKPAVVATSASSTWMVRPL